MTAFRGSPHVAFGTTALQRTITAAITLVVTANAAMAQHSQQAAPQQAFAQPQQPLQQQQQFQQQPQQGPPENFQPQQLPPQSIQQPSQPSHNFPQQQAPQNSQQNSQLQEPLNPQQNPQLSPQFLNAQSAGQGPGPAFAAVAATTVTTTVAASCQIRLCQEFHCEYVIDLLFRNQFRQQSGAIGTELAPGFMLSAPPSATVPGDLELLNVALLSDGSPTQGPVVEVIVRNNSQIAVEGFQISVVGVVGQMHAQCPTARGLVSQIAAGSVGQFQMQLPVIGIPNGSQAQQPAPFETLVVAIDSFDELLEANELNNVRIIRRAELLAIAGPPMSMAQGIPVAPNGLPSSPADIAIPSTPPSLSPLDSLMQEDSGLETTRPTAVGTVQFLVENIGH